MSYVTRLYVVELARLKKAVGSRDENLFKRIKGRQGKIWRHNERVNADRIAQGEPGDEQALTELLHGKFTRPEDAPVYGYALQSVCSDLGRLLCELPEMFDLKLDSPLERRRLPVRLPPWEDDFPFVSYLTAREVAAEMKRLSAMDLTHAQPLVAKARQKYLACIAKAEAANQAVVTFYY
jgi:hypothetical protein